MSGHSKWSTIKRKKEAEDQKRGAIFTKLARAISIAVQKGGSSDPNMNFALRLAIDQAKAANMPKDNIQKAIKRGEGKGKGEESLKEIVYEGFGPLNVAIMLEALTDNPNRTYAQIKKIFEKRGGQLASPGSTSYLFEKKGLLLIDEGDDSQQTMLKLIDLGAEDVELVEDGIEIYVPPEKTASFSQLLAKEGFNLKGMELIMKPKTTVVLQKGTELQKVLGLMEELHAHGDIQKTWANFR